MSRARSQKQIIYEIGEKLSPLDLMTLATSEF
ncbi:MAG: hypothetical protein ACJAS4_003830 [Bacteriovoracaceae bacterium]|jgi:hypothetical protein